MREEQKTPSGQVSVALSEGLMNPDGIQTFREETQNVLNGLDITGHQIDIQLEQSSSPFVKVTLPDGLTMPTDKVQALSKGIKETLSRRGIADYQFDVQQAGRSLLIEEPQTA